MNSTTSVGASNIIIISFSVVLTIIGIVGNIFVIYILTRPKFIKGILDTYSFYY